MVLSFLVDAKEGLFLLLNTVYLLNTLTLDIAPLTVLKLLNRSKKNTFTSTEQDDRAKCSSFCKYSDMHGDLNIGSIQAFLVNPPLAIIARYCTTKYCPAVRPPRRPSIKRCIDSIHSSIAALKITNSHQLLVVPIDCITSKCVVSNHVAFSMPNHHEHH